MKPKKLKCYVIMIARVFPAYHPRKGEYTCFIRQIIEKEKIHTLRGNYEIWAKRIKEVQEGKAYLSLRFWDGGRYIKGSKQVEFKQLHASDGVGVQKLVCDSHGIAFSTNHRYILRSRLAMNDGLETGDFLNWFKPYKKDKPFALIHFTDFRY